MFIYMCFKSIFDHELALYVVIYPTLDNSKMEKLICFCV